MDFRDRTHEEEADCTLSIWIERIYSSFVHLHNSTKHLFQGSFSYILLVRTVYTEGLKYYSERASVCAESNKYALDILNGRHFNNAHVILEKNLPNMGIWKFFNEILVVALSNDKPPINVLSGYATRGQNIMNIYLSGISADSPTQSLKRRHCCAEDNLSKKYFSDIEIKTLMYQKRTPTIMSGNLYQCDKCGFELYFESIPIHTLRKIHSEMLKKGTENDSD